MDSDYCDITKFIFAMTGIGQDMEQKSPYLTWKGNKSDFSIFLRCVLGIKRLEEFETAVYIFTSTHDGKKGREGCMIVENEQIRTMINNGDMAAEITKSEIRVDIKKNGAVIYSATQTFDMGRFYVWNGAPYHTYYLYEYIGDGQDFLSSASAALTTSIFNVNEVFVEGDNVPVAGDVNGDGSVTAADVTVLYNWLLNNDNSAIVNGDQNGDGSITSADVTFIYNILLGSK